MWGTRLPKRGVFGRPTSKESREIVAVHSSLRLAHRKTPEYQREPETRWDVNPEDSAQIDDEDGPNELHHGLIGVPLVTQESDSDSDNDIPIDGLDDFMQHMDVEDQSLRLSH